MKKLKYFSLLVFLFCLTGCGYKDVYEKYQSTIDGLDHCTYETTDVFSGYSFEKYSMTFTMDANGIYLNGDPLYDLNRGYSITNQFGPPIRLSTPDINDFVLNLGSSGKCPKDIYLNVKKSSAEIKASKLKKGDIYHYTLSEEVYKNGNSTAITNNNNPNKNNSPSPGSNTLGGSNQQSLGTNIETSPISCEDIFKNEDGSYNQLYYAFKDILTLLKFLAPILLVVFSTLDYIKAITSHDAEGLKKANTNFVKRLIIGVFIFLLPYLLDFSFETFGLYDLSTCDIGK